MRKDKFKQVCHLIAGFAVITRAYQSFEQGEFKECAMYILLGSLFLVISGIEEWIVKRAPRFESIIFFAESAAFLYISLFDEFRKSLKYTYFGFTAVFFLLGVYFLFFSKKKHRHKHRRSKRKKDDPTHSGYKFYHER